MNARGNTCIPGMILLKTARTSGMLISRKMRFVMMTGAEMEIVVAVLLIAAVGVVAAIAAMLQDDDL